MQTTFDITGTVKRVTFYVSPTHGATLNRIIPSPGSDQRQYHYMLVCFPRVPGDPVAEDQPCLIISSETTGGSEGPVLVAYDDTGRQILRDEPGHWVELDAFERKALSLANERLATNFVERAPRNGRDS